LGEQVNISLEGLRRLPMDQHQILLWW